AQAILTAKGGMTSHAALVARGWGKCCIVGCSDIHIDTASKTVTVKGKVLKEGDWISLNGTKGNVYEGKLNLLPSDPEKNKWYKVLMTWADQIRQLGVRTNADRPEDASQARKFGAEGIGLTRTEHMFFDPERILAMREMIVAENYEDRRKAVMKLLPFQKKDFMGILKAMEGLPVTIRLLDPPLHEFVNLDDEQIKELSGILHVPAGKLKARIQQLHELNPMLGHRGCRLGITYPEVSEMQARAILEATAELTKKKVKVFPEIMIPLIGTVEEFKHQRDVVLQAAAEVEKKYKIKLKYSIGTMIEIPRACIVADKVAEHAEFFSFGTNDLTQTTFGFSRDDIGSFLPTYLEQKILKADPFQTIDINGVGQLVEMGVKRGRASNPKLKIGICGEHGGEPNSVEFCHVTGLNYVSCSPFRVPIARLAAAHAAIKFPRKEKTAKAPAKKKSK
ncbi:MAG: PEP-utilizing enzyme, partial [bacterium]|nr:PEP-utilizing enzyme [bacterium]